MDVSDIVEYNASILTANDLGNSFFCLSRDDPMLGFPFDATIVAGQTYPETSHGTPGKLLLDEMGGPIATTHRFCQLFTTKRNGIALDMIEGQMISR
jgi:hypothetical protein